MNFIHCDHSEAHLSLHDCMAEGAYFRDGVLGFECKDGFWIAPDHPENGLSACVKTDASRVEYVLHRGEDCDVTVYVFKDNFLRQTVRHEWSVRKLTDEINSGKYKLEFLYQYTDGNARIVQCELHCERKPYFRECLLYLYAPQVRYFWNELREDRPW